MFVVARLSKAAHTLNYGALVPLSWSATAVLDGWASADPLGTIGADEWRYGVHDGMVSSASSPEDRFFDLFEQHSETLVFGSKALERLLTSGDIEVWGSEIISLEERADTITREVLLAVRRSFITPFDRGHIKDLIMSMDDAIVALGTLLGGWRIVHTMGSKITRLNPMQGFCAETGGAITLFAAIYSAFRFLQRIRSPGRL
jgi:hypothetical protein